jgi:AcrR family transcriptional regulator
MNKIQENQRRKPKQQRSIQKYNEILDASARILSKQNYQNASMQEISLESGHPYSTIYQYFENKEAIFIAWLERFIDTSLFGLSENMLEQSDRELDSYILDSYIEDTVHIAITAIVENQSTLRNLFNNMPMLTSKLIELMEARALLWLEEAFQISVKPESMNALEQSLLTTIRAGNGYWLQVVLSSQKQIDIEAETKNLSTLVKALLIRE